MYCTHSVSWNCFYLHLTILSYYLHWNWLELTRSEKEKCLVREKGKLLSSISIKDQRQSMMYSLWQNFWQKEIQYFNLFLRQAKRNLIFNENKNRKKQVSYLRVMDPLTFFLIYLFFNYLPSTRITSCVSTMGTVMCHLHWTQLCCVALGQVLIWGLNLDWL